MDKYIKEAIEASDIFDCNDITKFTDTVIQELDGFHGISDSIFVMCKKNNIHFLTKVYFYRKNQYEIYSKEKHDYMEEADVEIAIMSLFKREFIKKNATPCIIEMIYHKTCKNINSTIPADTPVAKIQHSHILSVVLNKIQDNNTSSSPKIAFCIMERADITLNTLIDGMAKTALDLAIFKSIIFQIIYTFYVITKKYPKFRHNDLHMKNVLLKVDKAYKFRANRQKFQLFHVGKTKFYLPYFGITPKIIDFGFSSLPEKKIYSKVMLTKISSSRFSVDDLLYLFGNIYANVLHIKPWSSCEEFFTALMPERQYSLDVSSLQEIDPQMPSAYSLLHNKTFDEYKEPSDKIYIEYFS